MFLRFGIELRALPLKHSSVPIRITVRSRQAHYARVVATFPLARPTGVARVRNTDERFADPVVNALGHPTCSRHRRAKRERKHEHENTNEPTHGRFLQVAITFAHSKVYRILNFFGRSCDYKL